MRPQRFVKAALVACLVGASLMLAGPAFGQQGGPPPGKGGGGHTETATNQLSYPAIMIGASGSQVTTIPALTLDAADTGTYGLGYTYSYGCDVPEVIGTTTYPNTSCIKADGTYMNYAECVAHQACAGGATVSRIYWQKTLNYWKAEETTAPPGVTAQYVDWGDNLESKSWTTTSTIRVETTPFKDHVNAALPGDLSDAMKKGYQMWHVSGQGTDEKWGVRAAFDPTPDENGNVVENNQPTGVYAYEHPYSIIRTSEAKLNFTKLGPAVACPTLYEPKYPVGVWDGTKWNQGCSVKTEAYTAELNVGGKYVYGYNWSIRRDLLPATCPWAATELAGWWRLTFYTPTSSVGFASDSVVLTPPPSPNPIEESLLAVTSEESTGSLYIPVVSSLYNLTYIDICVTSGGGGGGKKGGQ